MQCLFGSLVSEYLVFVLVHYFLIPLVAEIPYSKTAKEKCIKSFGDFCHYRRLFSYFGSVMRDLFYLVT